MKLKATITLFVCALLAASCSSDDAPGNIEPQLITGEATDITRTSATLTGQVMQQGNAEVSSLFFRYGTTTDMELQTGQLTISGGQVSARLQNLVSNTQYYYCLQGGNGRVTLKGDSRDFTTQPGDRPTVGTIEILSQGPVSVIVGYDITSDGGETITETGVYIAEAGSDTQKKVIAESQTGGTPQYRARITDLKQNTAYELKAFAVNRNGESVGLATTHTTSSAITVSVAGGLSGVMTEAERNSAKLRIAGQLNGDDLKFLRDVLSSSTQGGGSDSQARDVDLTDVRIVEGGVPYDGEHYAEQNVIGTGLFSNCAGIKSLILPDNTTAVSLDAMENCTALKSLTIPTSATSVQPSAGCTALEQIEVSPMNSSFKSVDGILFDAAGQKLLWYPLGKGSGYGFPATVKAIGDYAFSGYGAAELSLPDNITAIGRGAFCDCKAETLKLPSKLETIATSTFQNCTKLSTAYIGGGTTLINDYAFMSCPLTSLHLAPNIPPVCSAESFKSTAGDVFSACTLYVPTGSKTAYRNHTVWGQFHNIVEE